MTGNKLDSGQIEMIMIIIFKYYQIELYNLFILYNTLLYVMNELANSIITFSYIDITRLSNLACLAYIQAVSSSMLSKNLLGTGLKFPTDIQRILVSRKAA